jgi:hypothetical protein
MTVSRRLRFEILRRDGYTCRYCGAQAPEVQLAIDHVVPVTLGGTDDPANLVAACHGCNSGKASIHPDSPLVEDVASDALRWKRALERAAAELHAEREVLDGLLTRFQQKWDTWTYETQVKVPPPEVPPSGEPIRDKWWLLMGHLARDSEPISYQGGVLTVHAKPGYIRDTKAAARRALPNLVAFFDDPDLQVNVVQGPVVAPLAPPPPTYRTETHTVPMDPNWQESVARFLSLGLTMDDLERYIRITMSKSPMQLDERFRYFCGCCWRAITDLQESARRILESE